MELRVRAYGLDTGRWPAEYAALSSSAVHQRFQGPEQEAIFRWHVTARPSADSEHPVGPVGSKGGQDPTFVDHDLSEFVPIGVLTEGCAIHVDQLLHDLILGGSSHCGKCNRSIEDDVGVEVIGGHVQAGPRVTAEVLRLGPGVSDRNPNRRTISRQIDDVGELGSPIAPQCDQDPPVVLTDECQRFLEVDAHGPMVPTTRTLVSMTGGVTGLNRPWPS